MTRVPPNELDAEAAVISTMMIDPKAIDTLIDFGFLPHHFYADAHRIIVEAILELHTASREVDVVTVAAILRERDMLPKVGGAAYVAQLTDATPHIAHVTDHARIVMERWRLRQAIAAAQLIAAQGYEIPEDTQKFLEDAENSIAEIAHGGRVVTLEQVGSVVAGEVSRMSDARAAGQTTLGLPTGFFDIDKLTGGLFAGDLIIIAARPGMGKTAFAASVSANIARATAQGLGHAVLFCSLEMPRSQMGMRFACHESGLGITRVRTSTLGRAEWDKLLQTSVDLNSLPIWIDDTPSLTLLELRAKVRKLKRELQSGAAGVASKGLGAVVIDYLQLMQGIRPKGATREEEVASLSRGLKALAKEEQLPVIALSQLNRKLEQNKDKRPTLADLRESGAIEQDADNVTFIYREAYYDRSADKNAAEVDIAKQRNGPAGTVPLFYDCEPMRFHSVARAGGEDWSPDHEDAYYR